MSYLLRMEKGGSALDRPQQSTEKIGLVMYALRSEVGIRYVGVHANRLKKTKDFLVMTGNPIDGVYPESVQILQKTSAS